MRKIFWIIISVVILLISAGCKKTDDNSDKGGLNIVATIFPAYDFARAVAEETAEITMLVKPGESIHSYDPSITDINKIRNADVFVCIGGESEAWVERILASVDKEKMVIIRLIDEVDAERLEDEFVHDDHDHDHDGHGDEDDEHIWTSPIYAIQMVEAIADGLCAADGENEEMYRNNAAEYVAEIRVLDGVFKDIVKDAPKNIIVVGDRFPLYYFVNEYGLEYAAAFGGCSDQTDASVATIARLVKEVRKNELNYIFYVELSTRNTANTISEETGAETLMFHSCQNVTRTEFESGETYVSLMQKNAENLRKGLN